MIRVESLCARFGTFRIDDVSLQVPPGNALVLLGPSGAGKSLLLETILGIKRPERGRVFIDGRDVTAVPPEERGIAYMPQDVALFPHLSVRENILFGLRARGVRRGWDKDLDEIAGLLDIESLLDRHSVRTLSGGERQRVALARALIVRPRVLFLDECFSALDAPIRVQLQEQLRNLKRSLSLTVFHVTHDQEEAFLLGDKVAIIMAGKIQQVATPDELYAQPASVQVARFLMMRNLFPASVRTTSGEHLICDVNGLEFAAARPPIMPQGSFHLGFHPAEVTVRSANGSTPPEGVPNVYRGRVVDAVELGHRRHIRVRLDAPTPLEIDCALPPGCVCRLPREREVVEAEIPPSRIRCLPG